MRLVVERTKKGEGSLRTLFSVVMVVAVFASVLSLGAFSQPVQADGVVTGTIAVVTEFTISVTISDGYPTSVDYGTVLRSVSGAEATPVSYDPSGHTCLQVTNDGNVAEDLLIRGADATGPGVMWYLSFSPGIVDTYAHLFGLGETPSTYAALSYAGQTLANDVPAGGGGTIDFNLKIQTPFNCDPGVYSTTVTVTAIAA